MSDNENPKAKSSGGGWSDKERLTYLFALIENSNVKLDYNTTPRPEGRSVIACQRMVDHLKGTLKIELEALQAGKPIVEGTPKKTPTPRKRKAKGAEEGNGDAEPRPTKRGRKKKGAAEPVEEDEEDLKVKAEAEDDV